MACQEPPVSVYPIRQATTATFADLYFQRTSLFFVERGSKRIVTLEGEELVGEEGDVFMFPPGSVVTMENRPLLHENYRATGVSYTQEFIDIASRHLAPTTAEARPQLLQGKTDESREILAQIHRNFARSALPLAVQNHCQIEPLIWLDCHGIKVPANADTSETARIRQLVEADLAVPWQAKDAAKALGLSEPTMRRRLSKAGQGFAKILLYCRLERGLTLLQTTNNSITQISFECGFKTPAHFSSAFKNRFGIRPKDIRAPQV